MKRVILFLTVAGLALPALAQNKVLVNTDQAGIALQGCDPVTLFTDHKPVKGNPKLPARRDGAIYYFTSKEHRDLFTGNPGKYEPAFGGYCAYGVSRNKLVEIDPDASQVVDGKLLLQYSKGVRDKFNQDPKGNLAKAEANWPVLVAKKGK